MEARMFIIFKLTLVLLKCDAHVYKRTDTRDGHSNLKAFSKHKGPTISRKVYRLSSIISFSHLKEILFQ